MRYACGVEYDGHGFLGFQKQVQEPTIQNCLEKAISKVANQPTKIICCGRTDTGVSASAQVIHFDTNATRSDYQWIMGINTNLPKGISLLWIKPVSDDFHARFSAIQRSYQYVILNRWIRPAINRHHQTWEMLPLDEDKMHQASQYLVGKHDFNSFRSSGCQSKTSIKTINSISVIRDGNKVIMDVAASGFLHHMIRNIIGSLLPIGRGEKPVESMLHILQEKDRTKAGITAPPNGLSFNLVKYPKKFNLPELAITNHLPQHYEQ
ncbi:tRNA pseudouridine(38-40) synthase [hydrothermal vent metagenome]|uniref:tRNA pseudouridine(38-40) synthase n=1 Tax=hydrothermal vent metagenome TaxID=652676 RepID=A0A3B0VQK6_9ZZZZ